MFIIKVIVRSEAQCDAVGTDFVSEKADLKIITVR